jgi:4-hydroxy-tetrahydrodipicolinate reductase
MKIALVGYGKMGKMIESIALQRKHTIVARLDSSDWDEKEIQEADVCIEFTTPNAAVDNICRLASQQKPIVVGTTGWYHLLPTIAELTEKQQVGILYGPNFSVGIHLLLEIIPAMARLINPFEEFDVAGIEYHHRQKKDLPSGTADAIAHAIEAEMPRIEKVNFSSVRCGSFPGTHTVLFDSPNDTLTISHSARNRESFASGAILAAEWLIGRKGLFTFSDCVRSLLTQKSG